MKLFVVCFGAALAATVVAAQIGGNKDTAPGIESQTDACEDTPEYYYGNNCIMGGDGSGAECWDDRMLDLGFYGDGVCCYDSGILPGSFEDKFCKSAYDAGCTLHNAYSEEQHSCGRCIHQKIPIPPPPPPPCPCTTSCCREKSSLDELFADSETNSALFEKWTTLNTQQDAVFIGDDVGFCRNYTQKMQVINETASDNETTEYYVAEFSCYDLCCDCCNNLDIASCEPARELIFKEAAQITLLQYGNVVATDASGDMNTGSSSVFENGYVRQHAAPAKTTNFPGPAAICVYDDSMVLFTHSLGVVAFESASSFTGHRISVGCPKKQDGSNAGFVVPEQNTTESASAPAPTPRGE